MKKFAFVSAMAAIMVVLGLSVSVTPAFAEEPVLVPIRDLANGPSPGIAKLFYTRNGLRVQVKTTGLPAFDVVTMWWQVFHPNPAGGFVYTCDVRADGAVLKPSGKNTYISFLHAGRLDCVNGDNTQFFDPDVDSLVLVIRDHGPVIPGMLYDMLSDPNGGCKLTTNTDEENDRLNSCADMQIAVYIHP